MRQLSYSGTNVDVQRRLGIPPLSDIGHYRRLVWMGKIAQMPLTRLPRKLLAAWTQPSVGKQWRPTGARKTTTCDSFLQSLQRIGLGETVGPNGLLETWIPLVDTPDWKH